MSKVIQNNEQTERKFEIMAKTKRASDTVSSAINKEIQKRNKQIQKLNKQKRHDLIVERIQDEMNRLTEEQGQKFRNIDLAKELGIHSSLVTKWFKNGREIKDHHLQAMANFFHVSKSWIDGSSNARIHESYNSVIEKTGLTEEAIECLIKYKDIDRIRADDYSRLAESAKEKNAMPNHPKPISRVDIISEMITHKKFPSVVSTLEVIASEMPKEAKGHFADYDEMHDSRIFTVMKNLEAILLDCIDELIEE